MDIFFLNVPCGRSLHTPLYANIVVVEVSLNAYLACGADAKTLPAFEVLRRIRRAGVLLNLLRSETKPSNSRIGDIRKTDACADITPLNVWWKRFCALDTHPKSPVSI